MKILITLWISLNLVILAQTDCGSFRVLIKKIDKTYSELSQNQFQNYFKCTILQKDICKISLHNINGELVYEENFGILEDGTHLIKIFNPRCPGAYFASIENGNSKAVKAIIITTEEFPSDEVGIYVGRSSPIIEGIWMRNYSEKIIAENLIESKPDKTAYLYNFDMQIHFLKDTYKIVVEKSGEGNLEKETKTFEGKFIVNGDTLKMYENSKLAKVFQYKIEKDSLVISHFLVKDMRSGAIAIPMEMNFYNNGIKFVGKYHK